MYWCEICNREFKNGAGLAGHKQLKHGKNQGKRRFLSGFRNRKGMLLSASCEVESAVP